MGSSQVHSDVDCSDNSDSKGTQCLNLRRNSKYLNKSDIRALDYVVDSALKKIFVTNSKKIMLDLNSIGDVLFKRQRNFLLAYGGLGQ